MKKVDNILGGAGVFLTAVALIWYSITRVWEIYHWIMIVPGIGAIAYFLFIYFTKREKVMSSRSLKQGSNVLIQVIVVLVIVGMLAFISTRQHFRSDLTEGNLYSLSDQTDKILSNLDKEVEIKGFFKSADQRGAKDLLDEYDYRSGNLSFELIDPDEDPAITKQYGVTAYNSLVVECGVKRELITDMSETNLTNAIIKVTREQDKVIYFLTGHGERSISDASPQGLTTAVDQIKKENHLVREINLAMRGSIPDSCSVLAIVSPQNDLFPTELDTIKKFIDDGGKVLMMVDPDRGGNLPQFLTQYHIVVGKDMVIERSAISQLMGAGPGIPLINSYDTDHLITKDFEVMTFVPYTASVTPDEETGGYKMTELMKTSGQSWAETDWSTGNVGYDANEDRRGPITVAVVAENEVLNGKSVLAVFGDSDFASNAYFNQQGNGNLFLNTINYLAEEEDLISIRPKQIDDRRLTLTQADVSTLFYLVVIAVPLLVIILGVVIFFKRNRA